MTHYTEFEKAVKHVRDCLFWDFVDGVWNDVIVTPLDRNYFNRLMQQVSDAHAREVETLNAENAKLRELAGDLIKWCEGPCGGCINYDCCDGTPIYEFWATTKDRARTLGVKAE